MCGLESRRRNNNRELLLLLPTKNPIGIEESLVKESEREKTKKHKNKISHSQESWVNLATTFKRKYQLPVVCL